MAKSEINSQWGARRIARQAGVPPIASGWYYPNPADGESSILEIKGGQKETASSDIWILWVVLYGIYWMNIFEANKINIAALKAKLSVQFFFKSLG